MARCKSGLHEWLNPQDAAKCCNGYRRVLLLGAEARHLPAGPTGIVEGTWYGYAWVPVVTDDKSSGLRCTCEYEECDASPEPGHTYCAAHLAQQRGVPDAPREPEAEDVLAWARQRGIAVDERTPGAPLDLCACEEPDANGEYCVNLAEPGQMYCAKHLAAHDEDVRRAPMDMCACGHMRYAHVGIGDRCLSTRHVDKDTIRVCACESFALVPATFAKVPDCSAARAATAHDAGWYEAVGDQLPDNPL